jgi:glycosyltransferase involved in cell wall biosynthesis
MKLLFIHNIMAPYRLPVFRELSKYFDLKMFFIHKTHNYRRWKISQEELGFNHTVSRGIDLGPARITFNLCSELAIEKYGLVIIGEGGVETIPSCLIAIFFKYVKGLKIVLMTERFELTRGLVRSGLVKKYARALFNLYLKFLYRHCDAFVACSSKAVDYLRCKGIADRKIFRSAQAVFDINRSPASDSGRCGKDIITILTVAYLEDRKGIDHLIKAFKALDNAGTELIIAGDGKIRRQLESMAEGHNNIIFKGHVDGDEKRYLYETADIFVLPSRFETWGLVVNEAMHYGLPVIITEAMGSTDLIDGNGMVVPAGDSAALVNAMKILAESRETRSRMSRRSLEIIGSVDLNAVTEPFINAIGHASGNKPCFWRESVSP